MNNILLLCHDYHPPFLSVATQYAALFKGTTYNVITVFLKGLPDKTVTMESGAQETIFLECSAKDIGGLKRKSIKLIAKLHQQYQFSFCIAHRYKALYIASHITKLFVIGVCHIDGVFNKWHRRYYVKHCPNLTLLGVSRAIQHDIEQALDFVDQYKINYLYNSLQFETIQAQFLSRTEAQAQLGLNDNDFLFINVGRLHSDKDQATLLKGFAMATAKMPKAKLLIAGQGPLEASLKDLTRQLEVEQQVIFLGMIPQVYRYLKAFDCFVLSSIREGLPVALLEAFAANLVCVASLCNGNVEAIEGAGFAFDVGDAAQLSKRLINVYQLSQAERTTLLNNAHNKINLNFTQDAVQQAFWNLPVMQRFPRLG